MDDATEMMLANAGIDTGHREDYVTPNPSFKQSLNMGADFEYLITKYLAENIPLDEIRYCVAFAFTSIKHDVLTDAKYRKYIVEGRIVSGEGKTE